MTQSTQGGPLCQCCDRRATLGPFCDSPECKGGRVNVRLNETLRRGAARIAEIEREERDPQCEMCDEPAAPSRLLCAKHDAQDREPDWRSRALHAAAEAADALAAHDALSVRLTAANRDRDRTIALGNAFARAAKRHWVDWRNAEYDRLVAEQRAHARTRAALADALNDAARIAAAESLARTQMAACDALRAERDELAAIVRALAESDPCDSTAAQPWAAARAWLEANR